jgi:hypothetical protein
MKYDYAIYCSFILNRYVITSHLLSDIGKPLELDTDGIWTLLPKRLPQSFRLEYKTDKCDALQYKNFNFICTLLNLKLFQMFSNPQYMVSFNFYILL